MSYWIFQGNPNPTDHKKKFDLDRYISEQDNIVWSTNQHKNRIKIDDLVFIWRAAGSGKKKAIPGVVAVATITGLPKEMPDHEEALKYYKNPEEGRIKKPRVPLIIEKRCIQPSEVVKKDCLPNDPILNELRLLTKNQCTQTNYPIGRQQGLRLYELCLNTSRTHNLEEIVAVEALNDNPEEKANFLRKVRKGQPQFRLRLLHLYDSKCAISGWGPECVLEAAHIDSHSETGINHSKNGLILRADIHYLFDGCLLKINPETLKIVVDSSLKTTDYWQYNGVSLRQRIDGSHPSKKYLQNRWNINK